MLMQTGMLNGVRVAALSACLSFPAASAEFSLRFFGHGLQAPQQDRVKIRIDDPARADDPGPPVDVGGTDFTIEFWMKARAADNAAPPIACNNRNNWIYGNIIIDRDRYGQGRNYGISIAGGRIAFGVMNAEKSARTVCGTFDVLDGRWHHVALQRRRADGQVWVFVDGRVEARADGPDGDISYPDDGVPRDRCGGPCNDSDPFLVLGAEKHDAGAAFPSYSGYLDELRVSTTLRYATRFTPPSTAFHSDTHTAALYHFNEGPAGPCTGRVGDAATAAGGPSDGECRFGGKEQDEDGRSGPVYTSDTPFAEAMR